MCIRDRHVPGMFSQWNGYELERVFGIQALNVKDLFSTEQWGRILKRVEAVSYTHLDVYKRQASRLKW